MLDRIIRRKINEAVESALECLELEEILEKAIESILDDYSIENIILENIEDAAKNAIEGVLDTMVEDIVIEELETTFEDML